MDQQNGQLTFYHIMIMETQVLYSDDGRVFVSPVMNTNRTYLASENHTQVIDTLKSHHNYSVSIAAATSVGLSSYSPPYAVTTHDGSEFIIHWQFAY